MACIGERGGAYRDWVGKVEGKSQLEDLGLDGRIILKLTLKKWVGSYNNDWPGSGYRDRWRAFVNAVMNLRVP